MRQTVAAQKTPPSYKRAPLTSMKQGVSRDVLSSIGLPHINLSVWRRWIDPGHSRALGTWAEKPRSAFDATLDPRAFDSSILVRSMPLSLASWLQNDMENLLKVFSEFAAPERVRVQWHATCNDQCRKFHVDNLRYRMITTYLGPGTEYVPENNVNRHAFDRPFSDFESANLAIIRDESRVFRARAGDVLLMKGVRASPGGGAVHRSPPIDCSDLRRVVFVLSTVDR